MAAEPNANPASSPDRVSPPTLSETLAEAHSRAMDAGELHARRMHSALAFCDLGAAEAATQDLVVTLVQAAEVVSAALVAGPSEPLELPTLFAGCASARSPTGAVPPGSQSFSDALASLVIPPAAAEAAEAAPAAQAGPPSGAALAAPAKQASLLQQLPNTVNAAIAKMIESEDMSSNMDQARTRALDPAGAHACETDAAHARAQMMRRRAVRPGQPAAAANSSPRKAVEPVAAAYRKAKVEPAAAAHASRVSRKDEEASAAASLTASPEEDAEDADLPPSPFPVPPAFTDCP